MSNFKAEEGSPEAHKRVHPDSQKKTIGAYLQSREGKRWRSEDTRAILARAAEMDRIMERLLMVAGIPVVAGSKSDLGSGAFTFATTAHAS